MDLMSLPVIWAQAQPAGANPDMLRLLALRRWCSSLTLSSPQVLPDFHGLWAALTGLAILFVLALFLQGPAKVLKQIIDLPGHFRLLRDARRRVWAAGRLVSIAIGFTVVSWTGSQAMVFNRDSGRLDLILLTKLRGLSELAIEQGVLAGLTPLRDLAGLGDNLPLLVAATILLCRASFNPPGPATRSRGSEVFADGLLRKPAGWSTLIWCCCAFYALYRIVVRGAGNTGLPLAGCLVIEAVIIPLLMLIADGFLLAWVLAELRNSGLDQTSDDRLDPLQATALMPAAALACVLALPARYMATFIWLTWTNLPLWVSTMPLGSYLRWQVGWGLTDLQAASLVTVGLVGVVAWGRGSIRGSVAGYRRMVVADGGHLIVALAMAFVATAVMSAAAYAVVLLLPAQSWVLAAADSYAHFATLPVGLWTLAAMIELGARSLPFASLAASSGPIEREMAPTHAEAESSIPKDAHPHVAAPR
jgi:hypothetical protein